MTPKPTTVLELFEGHPERWTQCTCARNASGGITGINSDEATRWCLVGAIKLVYGKRFPKPTDILREIIPGEVGITKFNDSPSTTFDMVLEKVKEAGI